MDDFRTFAHTRAGGLQGVDPVHPPTHAHISVYVYSRYSNSANTVRNVPLRVEYIYIYIDATGSIYCIIRYMCGDIRDKSKHIIAKYNIILCLRISTHHL